MKTKACIDCGKRKTIDAFYRIFKDSERRQSRCKPCDNRRRAGSVVVRGQRQARDPGYSDHRVDAVRQPDGAIVLVRTPRRRAS